MSVISVLHNHSQQNTTAKASLAHFSSVPGKLQQGREKGCVAEPLRDAEHNLLIATRSQYQRGKRRVNLAKPERNGFCLWASDGLLTAQFME